MSVSTHSTSQIPAFAGRQVTAGAIAVAAFGSASLNVYGAFHIFPNPVTGAIFGVVIAACEVIACLSLRHIMADWQNNRYWKASAAGLIFALAIAGCVISGKQAFHVLFLEADANHRALAVEADRLQQRADAYHAQMLAGVLTDIPETTATARWESKQASANSARLAEMKAKPPHFAIVFVLLALFEAVKIGGLWSIATPTEKGETWNQRKARKRAEQLARARADAKHAERLRSIDDDDSNVTPLRKEA